MKLVALASVVAMSSAAAAAPFKPFVDTVGVTKDGVIITTTTATGTAGPSTPAPSRYELVVFAADGTELAAFRPDSFGENSLLLDKKGRQALDAWLLSLKAAKVATVPLPVAECSSNPKPKAGETACPAGMKNAPGGVVLVRDGAALTLVSDGKLLGASRAQVVELGKVCVLLVPGSRGHVDGSYARAVACPAK